MLTLMGEMFASPSIPRDKFFFFFLRRSCPSWHKSDINTKIYHAFRPPATRLKVQPIASRAKSKLILIKPQFNGQYFPNMLLTFHYLLPFSEFRLNSYLLREDTGPRVVFPRKFLNAYTDLFLRWIPGTLRYMLRLSLRWNKRKKDRKMCFREGRLEAAALSKTDATEFYESDVALNWDDGQSG